MVLQALWANVQCRRQQKSYAEQQSRPAMIRRCLHVWLQTAAATKQRLAGVRSAGLLAQGLAAWRHFLQVVTACQTHELQALYRNA